MFSLSLGPATLFLEGLCYWPYTSYSRGTSYNALRITVAIFLSEWIIILLIHFQFWFIHFHLSVCFSIGCSESLVCYHSSRSCFMISHFHFIDMIFSCFLLNINPISLNIFSLFNYFGQLFL